jgi:hypothetical protein
MSKIGNLGNLENDLFEDFAISSMNNVNIGQYSAKGINGTRNVILGKNAGKIAYELNNSVFIGTDAGSAILTGNKNFMIGDDKCGLLEVNSTFNIGFNEIHKNNSINIGLNIINSNDNISINNQFSINNEIAFKDYLIGDIINLGSNNTLNSNINIGHYNSNINLSIGTSNTSINSNAIIIGNNIDNYKFSLNIDNFICKYSNNQSNLIYLGIGYFKDVPIIIGSKNDFNFNLNDTFFINNGLTTNIIKFNNDIDGSIFLKINNNQNGNIIYYLPPLPEKYENIFLSTDKEGNLNWIEINDVLILTIITQGDTICNDLSGSNIYGKGAFLTHININDKNTDELNEGIRNLYLNVNKITTYFHNLLFTISTNIIAETEKNIYFSEKRYLRKFVNNINSITTDNINIGEKKFYNSNDYYSNPKIIFQKLTTDNIKEGDKNLFFDEEGINNNLDNVFNLIKEGTSNFYLTNERLLKNFNNYLNLYNTNKLIEGSNNLYYNDIIASNTVYYSFSNITTDLFREGSNLYSGDERILNFFTSKIINTNDIISSNNFNYFNSNSNIIINSDLLKEGSNRFLNNQNVYNTITFNTNTDFYKTGNSNIYGTEKIIISDFSKITSNDLNTDYINDLNNKNKFIKNNFYNSDINVNGILKANNINDINLVRLREIVNLTGIGDNTEIIQTYDVNTFNINTKLSNMEISYSTDNNNKSIPFIVINDKVGIHNINPKYELDVNGIINCSNLIFNEYNLSNLINKTVIKYDNNFNVGIGTNNPAEKLQVIGNILASGTIISSFSDIRLKEIIEPLKNPLDIIQNLNGFKYKLNELGKSFGFNDKIEIGLNAQEVLKNIPEIVSIAPFDSIRDGNEIKSKTGENYLSLQYERIIPYLIEGIKELKKENEELKQQQKEINKKIFELQKNIY